MTRTSPPRYSFSSGEISPLLHGRPDFQRHQTGLRTARGFIPLKEGGVTRAPGSIRRGNTRANAAARLVSFIFAANDAVVLEFTALRMRVWRYGQLVMAGASPFELVTPYDAAAISRLQFEQSADVIYVTDGVLPPRRLARLALDSWTLTEWQPDDGPFRPTNVATNHTVQASGATGIITLTASAPTFSADMVGGLFRLEPFEYPDIPVWTGNTAVVPGNLMRFAGNIYGVIAGTNTGVTPPTHVEGVELVDKTQGIRWVFVSDGVGIVRITGVSSPTSASAAVLRPIPQPCVAAPTYRWAEGAWSQKNGYPASVTSADQRLVLAGTRTDPRTIWHSAVGGFSEFLPGVDADSSFAFTIAGTVSRNPILWLQETDSGIAIGALGQVLSARTTDAAVGLSALTSRYLPDANIGVSGALPIAPDGLPIFISRDRARVFELRYQLQDDANVALELSAPSAHLGVQGFEEIVWQAAEQRAAWLRRSDGTLAMMLYDPNEDTLGWAVVPVAGGSVESLCATPDAFTGRDTVTMVVRRTISGATVRFVEELALPYGVLSGAQPIAEAVHYYAATIFAADPPIDTFSMPWLVGATVRAWTDKGDFGPFVVPPSGDIQLPDSVSRATIGLFDETHEAETLDIRAAAPDGATTGRRKRILPGIGIRVHRTAQLEIAGRTRALARPERTTRYQRVVDVPVAADLSEAYSGVAQVTVQTGNREEQSLVFRPVGGAPATVLELVPMIVQEGG